MTIKKKNSLGLPHGWKRNKITSQELKVDNDHICASFKIRCQNLFQSERDLGFKHKTSRASLKATNCLHILGSLKLLSIMQVKIAPRKSSLCTIPLND